MHALMAALPMMALAYAHASPTNPSESFTTLPATPIEHQFRQTNAFVTLTSWSVFPHPTFTTSYVIVTPGPSPTSNPNFSPHHHNFSPFPAELGAAGGAAVGLGIVVFFAVCGLTIWVFWEKFEKFGCLKKEEEEEEIDMVALEEVEEKRPSSSDEEGVGEESLPKQLKSQPASNVAASSTTPDNKSGAAEKKRAANRNRGWMPEEFDLSVYRAEMASSNPAAAPNEGERPLSSASPQNDVEPSSDKVPDWAYDRNGNLAGLGKWL